MFAACLIATGCGSPPAVQPAAGQNQYIVTVSCPIWHCPEKRPSSTQASVAAVETCARLGKTFVLTLRRSSDEWNPRYVQVKFECLAPYEIVPMDSETLALYRGPAKGWYRMWVPTSELGPGTASSAQVMQRPRDYCAKMNLTMKQTGGDLTLGNGLQVIFTCLAKQQEQQQR
jgi:hypothetical protein